MHGLNQEEKGGLPPSNESYAVAAPRRQQQQLGVKTVMNIGKFPLRVIKINLETMILV